jgi:iron(III) transport system permease protein
MRIIRRIGTDREFERIDRLKDNHTNQIVRRYRTGISGFGAVCYFLLVLLPFLGFRGGFFLPKLTGRRLGLLSNTLSLGFWVAVFCGVFGLCAAFWLWNGPLRKHPLRWSFLLLAPLPPYIYAMTWMSFARLLGGMFPDLMRIRFEGFGFSFFAQTMAFLPLCTALALIGLEQQDRLSLEAGLLLRDPMKTIMHILVPAAMPLVLSGMGIVFVLSVTDFTIPSLFQYPVYALEIFSEYSAAGDPAAAAAMAMPLFVITAAALVCTQSGLSSIATPAATGQDKGSFPSTISSRNKRPSPVPDCPGWIRIAGTFAIILCLIQIALPVFTLLSSVGSLSEVRDSVILASGELANSLRFSALAAGITLFPAAGAAVFLARAKRFAVLRWFVVLLPLSLPGSLVGIGLLTAVNGSAFYRLSASMLLPALGSAIHALPLAALILTAALRRSDREQIDAAKLFQKSMFAGALRIRLPLAAPGYAAAAAIVFLISMGEVGSALLLCPPGKGALSVKIYNYLHYGATETVAGFCLILALLTLAVTGVALIWFSRGRIAHAYNRLRIHFGNGGLHDRNCD